jgi:hypothetical protein
MEVHYAVHVTKERLTGTTACAIGCQDDGQHYWLWDDALGPFDTIEEMITGLRRAMIRDLVRRLG